MTLELHSLKTFLLDGDGVLYKENQPLPGLQRFFAYLEKHGHQWALLTNNSTGLVDAFQKRLASFDIQATRDQIFTSSTVAGSVLLERYGEGAPVYVVGEYGLKRILREAGLTVYHDNDTPDEVVGVVAAIDRHLTYQKLKMATRLIRRGADFIATNTDRTLPTPEGHIPGSGSVIAALTASTDREPTVMGKPETAMYLQAMKRFGATPETTVIIGDRLETDIWGGIRAGIKSIFVLCGAGTKDELQQVDYEPDLVVQDLEALTDALEDSN
jgi:4-nitrophenyl phosphatase